MQFPCSAKQVSTTAWILWLCASGMEDIKGVSRNAEYPKPSEIFLLVAITGAVYVLVCDLIRRLPATLKFVKKMVVKSVGSLIETVWSFITLVWYLSLLLFVAVSWGNPLSCSFAFLTTPLCVVWWFVSLPVRLLRNLICCSW